jgi:hypothetical protein
MRQAPKAPECPRSLGQPQFSAELWRDASSVIAHLDHHRLFFAQRDLDWRRRVLQSIVERVAHHRREQRRLTAYEALDLE